MSAVGNLYDIYIFTDYFPMYITLKVEKSTIQR